MTTLPGAPDGKYVVIQFATSFERKKEAVETITPMQNPTALGRFPGISSSRLPIMTLGGRRRMSISFSTMMISDYPSAVELWQRTEGIGLNESGDQLAVADSLESDRAQSGWPELRARIRRRLSACGINLPRRPESGCHRASGISPTWPQPWPACREHHGDDQQELQRSNTRALLLRSVSRCSA
ncbi:MAG TPA: DUF4019 domain-containing protein [Polyangia bacterium]|nr:DUF4019 domain-containing protein [Polyangia bacterium]